MVEWEPTIRVAGVVAAGLFSGSGLMEILVQQPARTQTSARIGLDQMQRVLGRADPLMPLLAGGSLVASLACCWLKPALFPAISAGAFVALFVLSGFLIKPVNTKIRALDLARAEEGAALVRRWGQLHALRSGAGMVGFAALALSFGRWAA